MSFVNERGRGKNGSWADQAGIAVQSKLLF